MIDLTAGTGKIQDEPGAFVSTQKNQRETKAHNDEGCQGHRRQVKRGPRSPTLDNLNNKIG